MKKIFLFLFLSCAIQAGAQDYFLLPKRFVLEKGETAVWRLFVGDEFVNGLKEKPVVRSIVKRFQCLQAGLGYNVVYEQGNYVDLLKSPGDRFMPAAKVKTRNADGLSLIHMDRGSVRRATTQYKFNEYLRKQHLNTILESREGDPSRDSVHEKYTRYLKSLISVGEADGELYSYLVGQTLEIVLLQNPYKTSIGRSISAQILFRDHPLTNAAVEALCRDERGRVYKQLLKSDGNGEVRFKVTRTGAWMVRLVHMIPSKEKDADWESFWATYTFGIK